MSTLLTLREASKRFYISPRALLQHIHDGNAPDCKVWKRGRWVYLISPDYAAKIARGEFSKKRSPIRDLAEQFKKDPPKESIAELSKRYGLAESSIEVALFKAGLSRDPMGRFLKRIKWLQTHPDIYHLGPMRSRDAYIRLTGDLVPRSSWTRAYRRLRDSILQQPTK